MESFKISKEFKQEMAKVVDDYKVSEAYHDALIKYDQDSFNEGDGIRFDDCHRLVDAQVFEADLSFLDENEDDEEATVEPAPTSAEAIEEQARSKEAIIELSSLPTTSPSKATCCSMN